MKIAIFTDTYFPEQVNGVAKVAYTQAQALASLGHEVRVWSVHNVPSVPFWGYKGERFALPLRRAYAEASIWQPDIVHAHTPFTLGHEAVRARERLGVPLVGTHHTFFDHYLKHIHIDHPVTRALSWQYLVKHYNHYDLVLSPSQALLAGMQAHGLTSVARFFPNGVDTNVFVPVTKEDKKVLKSKYDVRGPCVVYMGRVSYEKSIDEVIKAFALVYKRHSNALLLIVGDGPERSKLEELAQTHNISKAVRFTGMLHGAELLEALQLSDVFVTASRSENMPLSIIEAMATGLPVVGVDALGVPETVRDGIDGYIVPAGDVDSFATKVSDIIANDQLREKMSRSARERACEYSLEENARALVTIYESLLS